MPQFTAIAANSAPNLILVQWGIGQSAAVSSVEAQAWIDSHPGSTDAQIEAQLITLLQGRWTGRTDTVAVHLVSRSPLTVKVWTSAPGVPTPANWWVS